VTQARWSESPTTVTTVRHFAFIRAINTGGRRLSNDELLEPFRQLGFVGVAAYQAAGNVTFRTDDAHTVDPGELETVLSQAYGFHAPIFMRSESEMSGVQGISPFGDDELAETEGRVQVSFMHGAPSENTVAQVLSLVPENDRVVFSDREWFWLPTRGVSDSQLPVRKIEDLVGPMTMRTLGTISRMLKKFT